MKILRALMLVLTLSVCAYADGNMPYGSPSPGNMDNGVAGNMPNGVTTDGDMDNGVTATPTQFNSAESVTLATLESTLSVMQGALPVF